MVLLGGRSLTSLEWRPEPVSGQKASASVCKHASHQHRHGHGHHAASEAVAAREAEASSAGVQPSPRALSQARLRQLSRTGVRVVGRGEGSPSGPLCERRACAPWGCATSVLSCTGLCCHLHPDHLWDRLLSGLLPWQGCWGTSHTRHERAHWPERSVLLRWPRPKPALSLATAGGPFQSMVSQTISLPWTVLGNPDSGF